MYFKFSGRCYAAKQPQDAEGAFIESRHAKPPSPLLLERAVLYDVELMHLKAFLHSHLEYYINLATDVLDVSLF